MQFLAVLERFVLWAGLCFDVLVSVVGECFVACVFNVSAAPPMPVRKPLIQLRVFRLFLDRVSATYVLQVINHGSILTKMKTS